jgi:hypothetical protein
MNDQKTPFDFSLERAEASSMPDNQTAELHEIRLLVPILKQ